MAAAVVAAAAVKKAAMAVGVVAVRALQGLTAALDRDHARPHTIVLVTAQMADMTVVLGNGDALLELVTYLDTNTELSLTVNCTGLEQTFLLQLCILFLNFRLLGPASA